MHSGPEEKVHRALAEALVAQSQALIEDGDTPGATASYKEAIGILEEISFSRPWAAKKDLLKALCGRAQALETLGRTEEAEAIRLKAAQVAEQLPDHG